MILTGNEKRLHFKDFCDCRPCIHYIPKLTSGVTGSSETPMKCGLLKVSIDDHKNTPNNCPYITREWTTEFMKTEMFFVRAKVLVGEVSVLYEVFKVIDVDGDDQAIFDHNGRIDSLDSIDPIMYGTIKWDGCGNHTVGSFHSCSPEEVFNFGKIYETVYKIARNLLPNPDFL